MMMRRKENQMGRHTERLQISSSTDSAISTGIFGS
jgi:hypothetical protein